MRRWYTGYKLQWSGDMHSELTPEQLIGKMRNSAVGSLARREHSCHELRQKLLQKFAAPEQADEVIAWVTELGYLNDERFAGMFVRSSIGKGRGPERITRELQQKGVANTIIADALAENDPDWISLAEEVLNRKYPTPPQDYPDKAKRMRFLQYRGFSMAHISELM
jgi:regulatory protein